MTHMPRVASFFLVLSAAGAASAQADGPYQSPTTVMSSEIVYDVHADGTYTLDETELVLLNNPQGVAERSQTALTYSASLQHLDIVDAFTVTKDDQHIAVAPDRIVTQQSAQSAAAPMFNDNRVKTVIFPAVEVGSMLQIHWRRTQKIALIPNGFSMVEVFSRNQSIQSARVTLRAPDSMHLYFEAKGVDTAKTSVEADGTHVWQWRYCNPWPLAPEPNSVNAFDYSPHVAASTLPDKDAFGKAYLEFDLPRAAVTPAIQKLADEITAKATEPREQAKALYQWVAMNIRYVAVTMDLGGIVPHAADAIAANRYGDCKDHVTLLEALLSAKGIRSSPALVNLGDNYVLPEVAIAPGTFNHVISYLPQFQSFVDSTDPNSTFESLPIEERGKTALVTNDGSGRERLMTIPITDAQHDSVKVRTGLVVDAEGNIDGKSTIANKGVFATVGRQIAQSIPVGAEPQFASRMLAMSGQQGSGNYDFNAMRHPDWESTYSSVFSLPDQVQLPGPGALTVPVGLSSFSGLVFAFEFAAPAKRNFALPVVSGRREEVTELQLPPSVRISALPKAARFDSPLGHYESHYAMADNVVTVRRTLDIELPTATVAPDDYQKLRVMSQAVARDLRAQILYQPSSAQ